jgi:hypothetical protein
MSTSATAAPKEPDIEFANRPAQRLASIDAYRGLVMFLMMAEGAQPEHGRASFSRQRLLAIPRAPPISCRMGSAVRSMT